ncbi:DsbA family protein [Macrococcus carouselicus]|uniref:DsbA family protein n=1 Tax=Macrococcus carouselicus TaxID=69969 RepID=A0A9Q8FN23_9STAP|nr:DsbA family protein [Macrococcus carouselicus]TDM03800.1 DsbA family protein [Macrococcus carouselicus]
MKPLQLVEYQTNLPLQPVKKIEIYSFFDPFCKDSWELKTLLRKLQIEYNPYIEIKHILLPTLRILTKCQAQSTTEDDNIALAYKAAELQGRKKAAMFLRFLQNETMTKNDIITRDLLMQSAQKANLDLDTYTDDIRSTHVTNSLKVDQHIAREMEVNMSPTLVFFNENYEDDGLKVEGVQPYAIYTYIINELIEMGIEKELPPTLADYLTQHEMVSESELEIIYEWPVKILDRELKKLKLKGEIEEVTYNDAKYWRKKK